MVRSFRILEGTAQSDHVPAEDPHAFYTGPLVVLTSRLSASASEIVAGALKDDHRAVIVGSDHTFGKGSVQVLAPLPLDLGAITVTSGLYFLPGGKSTQKTGVEANVILPGLFTLKDIGEGSLDYPLPAQAIAPFIGAPGRVAALWKPLEQPLLENLAVSSRTRIAKDAKFAEILKNNKEASARKGIIRLAELRKEMEKESGSKKEETVSALKQKARDHNAPFVNEGVNILLDMVKLGAAQPASTALNISGAY